ncbi:erv26 superfamily protein [Stygiomarasmius scandens]|uniref:Erv26 superfamily protein n=1 Tax=Marasmiellus scandens TaxID=2682957 RepID=A0ABR1K6A4_9AGAR
MGLLYYVSYIAALVAFAFVTLSLASGLLYISELIEEHSKPAKSIGQRGIYAIIALHVMLYMTESLPLLHILFSIACHVVYLQNFSSTWPLINLSSLSFIASCVLVIVDHFMWFFHFARVTQDARHSRFRAGPHVHAHSFAEIATFFGVCVWLAPLFLFLSLSANDNALPTSSGASSPSLAPKQPQARVSLFRSIFSFIPGLGSKRGASEGLIAPPSPNPSVYQAPPSPNPYLSGHPPRSPSLDGPPRSPMMRSASFEAQSANFQLGTPPRRTVSRMATLTPDSGIGSGLRKSSSSASISRHGVQKDE